MRFTTSIVFSVLFFSATIQAELNEKCEVKNKYIGKCTYLTDCPYYDSMVQNYKSIGYKPDDIFKLLRDVNCGFVMADALVCCPSTSTPQLLPPPQNQDNAAGNSVPQESTGVEVVSQPTNLSVPGGPSNGAAPGIQAPVPSAPIRPPSALTTTSTTPSTTISTTAPVTRSTPKLDFPNSPTIPTPKPTTPTETTTPKTPAIPTTEDTIEGLDVAKFKRLLPDECGRVLTFKYFRGNRTEFDDFPWTTLIEYETPTGKQFGCGGALINSRYVLTAAHCVAGLPPFWSVNMVRFGEYDTDTKEDCMPDGPSHIICNAKPLDVVVEQVIVHPGFKVSDVNRLHDIALLRLSTPINFTDEHRPICLPTKNTFSQTYYTSGWGKDIVKRYIRDGTNLKYMSYVSLAERDNCQQIYNNEGIWLNPSHICGGMQSGEKPCIGDGGGPLMGLEERRDLQKRVAVYGVLSTNRPAIGECQNGSPSIYTKVLDYTNWIIENLKE